MKKSLISIGALTVSMLFHSYMYSNQTHSLIQRYGDPLIDQLKDVTEQSLWNQTSIFMSMVDKDENFEHPSLHNTLLPRAHVETFFTDLASSLSAESIRTVDTHSHHITSLFSAHLQDPNPRVMQEFSDKRDQMVRAAKAYIANSQQTWILTALKKYTRSNARNRRIKALMPDLQNPEVANAIQAQAQVQPFQ